MTIYFTFSNVIFHLPVSIILFFVILYVFEHTTWQFRRLSNLNLFLIYFSLSVIDIVLILDMVVQKCIVYHFSEPLWYRVSYPFIWHPIKGIILSATIFMVVAVSAERFRAICYPLSKRHVSPL